MSDQPTDKQIERCISDCENAAAAPDDLAVICGKMTLRTVVAEAKRARQLERELAEERAENERLKEEITLWEEALADNSEYEGDDAPWDTMQNEFARRDSELTQLKAQLEEASKAFADFANNFDCDSDAHKYGTLCRACAAQTILSTLNPKATE